MTEVEEIALPLDHQVVVQPEPAAADAVDLVAGAVVLGDDRQTIYHYFVDFDDLLAATAADGVGEFFDYLTDALAGITDAGQAVVEGIAITLERLPRDPYVGLMLRADKQVAFAASVTGDTARLFGMSLIDRLTVDWSQFDSGAQADILEIVLRTLQSFILAPLDAPDYELRRLPTGSCRWRRTSAMM